MADFNNEFEAAQARIKAWIGGLSGLAGLGIGFLVGAIFF